MIRLAVRGLRAGYGGRFVLDGIDFDLAAGKAAAFLGLNGSGKSTLLRALSGLIAASGTVALDGANIAGLPAHAIARRGVAHVPEGRGTFVNFTVDQNLRVGAAARRDRPGIESDLASVYSMFPVLAERRRQVAGSLSGGEQQMLAIGRGLMLGARLFLLDEPSLGLAPLVVADLLERLSVLRTQTGVSLIVVEQHWRMASRFADHVHILEGGRIATSASAGDERLGEALRRLYLGL